MNLQILQKRAGQSELPSDHVQVFSYFKGVMFTEAMLHGRFVVGQLEWTMARAAMPHAAADV